MTLHPAKRSSRGMVICSVTFTLARTVLVFSFSRLFIALAMVAILYCIDNGCFIWKHFKCSEKIKAFGKKAVLIWSNYFSGIWKTQFSLSVILSALSFYLSRLNYLILDAIPNHMLITTCFIGKNQMMYCRH